MASGLGSFKRSSWEKQPCDSMWTFVQLCAGSNYNQPGSTFQIAELLQASDIDFDSHALFLPMLQPSLSGILEDSNTQ